MEYFLFFQKKNIEKSFLSLIFSTPIDKVLTYTHKKSLQYKLKALQQCGLIFIT